MPSRHYSASICDAIPCARSSTPSHCMCCAGTPCPCPATTSIDAAAKHPSSASSGCATNTPKWRSTGQHSTPTCVAPPQKQSLAAPGLEHTYTPLWAGKQAIGFCGHQGVCPPCTHVPAVTPSAPEYKPDLQRRIIQQHASSERPQQLAQGLTRCTHKTVSQPTKARATNAPCKTPLTLPPPYPGNPIHAPARCGADGTTHPVHVLTSDCF